MMEYQLIVSEWSGPRSFTRDLWLEIFTMDLWLQSSFRGKTCLLIRTEKRCFAADVKIEWMGWEQHFGIGCTRSVVGVSVLVGQVTTFCGNLFISFTLVTLWIKFKLNKNYLKLKTQFLNWIFYECPLTRVWGQKICQLWLKKFCSFFHLFHKARLIKNASKLTTHPARTETQTSST